MSRALLQQQISPPSLHQQIITFPLSHLHSVNWILHLLFVALPLIICLIIVRRTRKKRGCIDMCMILGSRMCAPIICVFDGINNPVRVRD